MLLPVLTSLPRKVRQIAARFNWLETIGVSDGDVGAMQGVATDGNGRFWVAGGTSLAVDPNHSWIYEYSRDGDTWTLVNSRQVSADWTGALADVGQINSLFYDDGVLLTGANNDNAASPKKGWILEFDADDLSLLDSHATEAHWSEGGARRVNSSGEPEFWVCYADPFSTSPDVYQVSRYDSEWSLIDNYVLPVTNTSGSLFHEGLVWRGDLLFNMNHEGTFPLLLDVFLWDETSESFSLVQRMRPPTDKCTQGIHAGPANRMFWAERHHGVGNTNDHRVDETILHSVAVPAGTPRGSPGIFARLLRDHVRAGTARCQTACGSSLCRRCRTWACLP